LNGSASQKTQLTAKTTTSPVWRVSSLFASPSFEVNGVQCTNEFYIVDVNSLDRFENVFVLTNASDGNTRSSVECTISYCNVGRVGFGANCIVSVVDNPVLERDE
jgi:hypothetical protein